MSPIAILTPHQARSLKAALWHGEPGEYIADQFNCSVPLVRAISHGYRYAETEWPDGSTGALKPARLKNISRARSKARRECLPQITRAMNARVRAILEAAE